MFEARLVSNRGSSAFAMIRDDGTVITWGAPSRGGDSSSVEEQLVKVGAGPHSGLAGGAAKKTQTIIKHQRIRV